MYGGDAMSPSARALITDRFGIPVLSAYGANEAFSLGFECGEHLGYHVNVDFCPVRVIDSKGHELPVGERGEVVISNLVNRGTVLLNYRLGDLAAWLPGPCPCGRRLPLLTFMQSRAWDWIVTPSGKRRHPESVAMGLDVERDVIRYQAIQTAPARLTVKLVVAPGSNRNAIKQRVQRGLSERLGPGIATEVRFVDDLPRTARGKVRTVVGLEVPPT